MKHTRYVFFLIAAFSLAACSKVSLLDDYRPMLGDGYVWVYQQHSNLSSGTPVLDTVRYRISGDTLVGGVTYKKMYSSKFADMHDSALRLLLREDVSRQQVFVLIDGTERLLYDFSASKGETLKMYVNSHFDYVKDDNYYFKLTQTGSHSGPKGFRFREFYYDMFCKENGKYVLAGQFVVMERFGSPSGIADNCSFLKADEGYVLISAYDEHGNLLYDYNYIEKECGTL